MSKTNVCVIGPESQAIDACLDLSRKGYNPHTSARASTRFTQMKNAHIVLRVGLDGCAGSDGDRTAEVYAREIGKPVYRSLEQLYREVESEDNRVRPSRRFLKKK